MTDAQAVPRTTPFRVDTLIDGGFLDPDKDGAAAECIRPLFEEAASLVPAPDLDGLIAAINALPNPWSPEVSPDDFDPEAFVDRNAVLAILRAAASPTAHSAPREEDRP